MKVTVFGGAQPTEPDYQAAMRLGEALGRAGHTVLTGGYIGTMEAVSHGAAETGAHVIGITCEEIERWRKVSANAWVKEEVRYPTLRERLFALIDKSDAAIALPGGPGTLAEIALLWNQMVIESLPPRPLILVGEGWRRTFQTFFDNQPGYINDRDMQRLRFAADVDDAVQLLDQLNQSLD